MAMAPLEGLKVVANSGDKSYETVVDKQGKYEFIGLPPGTHKLSIALPSNLSLVRSPKLTVAAKGCAEHDFRTQSDGLISGRALNENGDPIKGIFLSLIYVDQGDSAEKEFLDAYTDEDGSFKFEGIPPADYLLGINIVREPHWYRHEEFPKLFYPNAKAASTAAVLHLEDGQKLTDLPFNIPTQSVKTH